MNNLIFGKAFQDQCSHNHTNTKYTIVVMFESCCCSVEVRVAVPLQEPATFRSYTWCLKVPPRCSKYTVVMRERITYQASTWT